MHGLGRLPPIDLAVGIADFFGVDNAVRFLRRIGQSAGFQIGQRFDNQVRAQIGQLVMQLSGCHVGRDRATGFQCNRAGI